MSGFPLFARVFGEQLARGFGQGGGRSPSFNQMTFTQALGAELLTNGNWETWTNPTTPGTWTKSVAGTSTVNQETVVVHGGSNAVRLDIDASNNNAAVLQATAVSTDDFEEITWWLKNSTTGKSCRADLEATAWLINLTTTYQQFTNILRASSNSARVQLFRSTSASTSIYGDDTSAKKLTLNAIQTGSANAETTFSFTLPGSPIAGQRVMMRYRLNATTPARDHWQAYLVRDDTNTVWGFKLDSVTAGAATNKVSVADVGSPDSIRVNYNGTVNTCYTGVGGVYTSRGSSTFSHEDTSTGVLAIYASAVTPLQLISYPL